MNISANILSGLAARGKFHYAVRAAIKDIKNGCMILESNGREITVEISDKSELNKGDSVVLVKIGQKLLVHKIPYESSLLSQMDSLDRGKFITSMDLRSLLTLLSDYPDSEINSLAREVINNVRGSILLEESKIAAAEKLLAHLVESVSKDGPQQASKNKLHSELITLASLLKLNNQDSTPLKLPGGCFENGFLSFSSSRECRIWLTENGIRDISGEISTSMPVSKESNVYIRISGDGADLAAATILNDRQLVAEVKGLLSRMESSMLRNCNPRLLQDALDGSTSISDRQLQYLDSAVATLERKDGISVLAPATQELSFQHIFNLMKTRISSSAAFSRSIAIALTPSATNLMQKVEFCTNDPVKAIKLPLSLESGIAWSDKLPSNSFKDFLSRYMESVGLTLESKLASAFPNEFAQKPEDLKSKLLRFMHEIQQTQDAKESQEMLEEGNRYKFFETGKDVESASALERMSMTEIAKVRRVTEGMLERIEALQILARPVSTSDGEQQVIAIPLRIGGEWTELRLKILKKKNTGSQGRGKKLYVVTICVCPRELGEVCATIRLENKKHCHISLAFQKQIAHSWFKRRLKPFREALKSLDFAAIRLEMHTMKSSSPQSNDTHSRSHNGILDITG